jgi:hypothetical protein
MKVSLLHTLFILVLVTVGKRKGEEKGGREEGEEE